MNTYIRVLVLSSVIVTTSKDICNEAPLSWQELGDTYVKSFGETSQNEVASDENTNNKPTFELTKKSEIEQIIQFCQIMAGCPFNYPDSHMSYYKAVRLMVRDFEVLYGSDDNPDQTVLSHLDRTYTLSGKLGLMKLLSQPICDSTLLKKRQAFIRYLVEHEEVLKELESLLQDFKEAEAYTLGLWDKPDQITSEWLDNNLYFGKVLKKFNTSSAMLELRTRLKHTFLGTCVAFSWGWELLYVGLVSYMKQAKPRSVRKSISDTYGLLCNAPSKIKELWALRSSDPQVALGFKIAGVYGALLVVANVYTTYRNYSEFSENKGGIGFLQEHLCRVSQGLHAADLMGGLVRDLGASDILSSWTFLDDSGQELNQLRTNTFAGSPSYFSYLGRVLLISRDKESIGNAMVPVLQAVGELDAYVSCARLYKEYVGKRATVSFVEFARSNKPYIHARGFWHPFIKPELAVKNDITMGAEYRAMILTGSNTGGKSTLLKSIGLNLLLAQTCGFAFADAMTLTPFSLLSSSLNISDNTAQGISLFKAEVLRARDINGWIDQLAPSDYGFVLVDELFNGTNSTSGSKAAARFTETIAQSHPNVLLIFATHFPQITELESRFTGSVANYMMDVKKEADGTITRQFRLEKGVSSVDIAQDLLDEN